MQVSRIPTQPYQDQKPGTAGLRRKVAVFEQPGYLENFIQAVLDSLESVRGATLVVGGDGRYHNPEAIQALLSVAAANGIRRIIIGCNGLLSTPAASNLIRQRRATGGFVFTASHNPAGPDGDFGVKFNVDNGGQASEALTDRIHARTLEIREYWMADLPPVTLGTPGTQTFGQFTVEVVDPVADYAELMASLFDFDAISQLLQGSFRMRYDAMHGVTGPYAKGILEQRLGAPAGSVVNAQPLADFAGGHPDPNLVYARELVETTVERGELDFAAASDGDGDRNMILGRGRFVSPGDSLAVLLAHAGRVPGYPDGVAGVARSMPTSRAADRVAAEHRVRCFETPTGWRFFCNLLDSGQITLCGEESFGTGSSHVREKDGLWAVLFWLNLLAIEAQPLEGLLQAHWQRFGRHYFSRHDYEALDNRAADGAIEQLHQSLSRLPGRTLDGLTVSHADEFSYHDPVDGSVSHHQGFRVIFGDQARIVLRRSGTGTHGATLRLYLEYFCPGDNPVDVDRPTGQVLAPLAAIAEQLIGIHYHSGRSEPSLIT